MNRSGFCSLLATGLMVLAFSLPTASTAFARQEEKVDTSGRFRLEAGGVFGKGFNREYIGTTANTNEPVHLRAGGGAGYSVTLGYGLSSTLDIDLSFTSITSTNKDIYIEGHAEFKKNRLLATLKYKIPFKASMDFYGGQIKLGAGLGYYFGTNMNLYYTNPMNLTDSIYGVHYKPALGFHASSEFEALMPNDWSFTLGLIVYHVKYERDSESYSGPDAVAWDNATDFESMNGSGADLLISLGKYFW